MAWGEWLGRGLAEEKLECLRRATRMGRPCGGPAFVHELEAKLGRPQAPQKRGPKPRMADETP